MSKSMARSSVAPSEVPRKHLKKPDNSICHVFQSATPMGSKNQKRPRLPSLDKPVADGFKFDVERNRELASSTTR